MPRLDPIRHYAMKSTGLDNLTKSDLHKLKIALDLIIDTMASLDLDGTRFTDLLIYRDRVRYLIKRETT
jgi:hypothetical protein